MTETWGLELWDKFKEVSNIVRQDHMLKMIPCSPLEYDKMKLLNIYFMCFIDL